MNYITITNYIRETFVQFISSLCWLFCFRQIKGNDIVALLFRIDYPNCFVRFRLEKHSVNHNANALRYHLVYENGFVKTMKSSTRSSVWMLMDGFLEQNVHLCMRTIACCLRLNVYWQMILFYWHRNGAFSSTCWIVILCLNFLMISLNELFVFRDWNDSNGRSRDMVRGWKCFVMFSLVNKQHWSIEYRDSKVSFFPAP